MVQKIKELLIEVKEDETLTPEKIREDVNIISDIGLDSLQLINFLLRIEDEFDVEMDFDNLDMTHLESLNAFCEHLNALKAA